MARYIDADLILPEMESKFDMKELYLPTHFQEFIVDEIPTADVAPVRHGSWIEAAHKGYKCSLCNCLSSLFDENLKSEFCPWCGAKMDEGNNDD